MIIFFGIYFCSNYYILADQFLIIKFFSVIFNLIYYGGSQVALILKKLRANERDVRDVGFISGSGRSPGGENGKPTPVFLPRESHGQRSLEGYSP